MPINNHAAEWQREHGDHTECLECGSQCRAHFMGETLTPAQKAVPELLDALATCIVALHNRKGYTTTDRAQRAVEKSRAALALAESKTETGEL